MTTRFYPCPPAVLAVMWLAGANSIVAAQEPAATAPKSESSDTFDEARVRIEKLTCTVTENEKQRRIEFSKNPIQTFSDPTRKESTGTVWLIGTEGRPRAILSLFSNGGADFWSYEFTSLSDTPVAVEKPQKWSWRPKANGLTIQDLKHDAVPGESPAARLAQMKAIARDFTASEVYFDGSRTELRLLTQPLHRYSDGNQQILDGALFAFAHGTNPEILMVIEAVKKEGSPASWRFGAARLSSAQLHLDYQQKNVWTIEGVRRDVPSDPYFSHREQSLPAQFTN